MAKGSCGPPFPSYLCFAAFLLLGIAIISTLLWLNRPFRRHVLQLNSKYSAPKVSRLRSE